MSKRGFIIPLIIVIIAVAALAAAFYIGKKSAPTSNSASPTPLSTETSVKVDDETANWKTYTDNTYGYTFKYPPTSSIKVDKEGGANFYTVAILLPMIDTKDVAEQSLSIITYKTNTTAVEQAKNIMMQRNLDKSVKSATTRSTIQIDNNNFEQLLTDYGNVKRIDMIGNKNGVLYDIWIVTTIKNEATTKTLVNQILSTFRFD